MSTTKQACIGPTTGLQPVTFPRQRSKDFVPEKVFETVTVLPQEEEEPAAELVLVLFSLQRLVPYPYCSV